MRKVDWYVHVDRGIIDANRKHGRNDPPVTIRRGRYGKSTKCFEVELPAGSVMVYNPHEPVLPCGARLVVKCSSEPTVIR